MLGERSSLGATARSKDQARAGWPGSEILWRRVVRLAVAPKDERCCCQPSRPHAPGRLPRLRCMHARMAARCHPPRCTAEPAPRPGHRTWSLARCTAACRCCMSSWKRASESLRGGYPLSGSPTMYQEPLLSRTTSGRLPLARLHARWGEEGASRNQRAGGRWSAGRAGPRALPGVRPAAAKAGQ